MRVVGLDLVSCRLNEDPFSQKADALRAWVSELEHRDFFTSAQLAAAFRQVDMSAPPITIFHLAYAPLRIDTVIDFRTRVVLVTRISEVQQQLQSANT
jgi:hypothetical protein